MSGDSAAYEKTRSEIQTAACALFTRFGFKKTTLEDIASEAKLGKASLYYYFKSKDEIFSSVVKQESETLLDLVRQAVGEQTTVTGKISAFVRARYEYIQNLTNLYRVTNDAIREVLPLAQKARKEYLQLELAAMKEILDEGTASGEFVVEHTEIVALVIMAALKGLDETFITYGRDEKLSQGLEVMLEVLNRGLKKS
jgi:AcrR family transcriptional regulator